ncbi:MAG: 30S ribosomal protein S4 [Pseudomonadota bacterium]
MARYTGACCRLCRREGLKLFLKGERCFSEKCAYERRAYPPGQHGQGRAKTSDYGIQLREKQKIRRMYGLLENQFRLVFEAAERRKGVTGWNLLLLLERRLDNIVYRAGFVSSRAQARQLIRHEHFMVNGRKVSISSTLISERDVVAVRESSRSCQQILGALESVQRRGVPSWLELSKERLEVVVRNFPSREDLTMPIQEQLVVELYSK